MKMQTLMTTTLAAVLLMQGCATTGDGKRDLSESMYLRGQFAWWDALPEYKVKKVEADLYRATAELKADGQPYEFKFGDASWSTGTNCGYLTEEDKIIKIGKKSKANCENQHKNCGPTHG